ncbi:MAG: GNAT family N-acetyltransferase [Oxalobacteraceae bacterium]|nr:MAG: GNAT family N-acetyltransferase [Oxalobacteraceae bacterium]
MYQRAKVEAVATTAALSHGTVVPLNLREGDGATAEMLLQEDGPRIRADVWRLSPMGVELRFDEGQPVPAPGEVAEMFLTFGNMRVSVKAVNVGRKAVVGRGELIGMRFCTSDVGDADITEKRSRRRLFASALYPPTGVVRNSLAFNDVVYFRLRDASSEGFSFVTSMRNKCFVPSSRWECSLSFPASEKGLCAGFEVQYAREFDVDGKAELLIGVQLTQGVKAWRELCGQYLLTFGADEDNCAPSTSLLREQGFILRGSSSRFSFDFVRSRKDYMGVIDLRERAYKETMANSEVAHEFEWGDVFDARSRILVARHRGRAVASCRLIFPEANDALEHESYCSLPTGLPPKDKLIECSRVCTDPEYRASDLLGAMFQFLVLTAATSGRLAILGNCHTRLLSVYRQVGNIPLGSAYTYVHPNDQSTHHLLLADVLDGISGGPISPLAWAKIAGPILPLIRRSEVLRRLSPFQKLRLRCLMLAKPLLDGLLWLLVRLRGRRT